MDSGIITCRWCKKKTAAKVHSILRRNVVTFNGPVEIMSMRFRCQHCDKFGSFVEPDLAPVGSRYGWDVIEKAITYRRTGTLDRTSAMLLREHGLKIAKTTIDGWERYKI